MRDLRKKAVSLNLSGGTILFLCGRHVTLYLVLVQPRIRPDMAENFLTGMGGSRGGGDRVSRPPPSPERSKIGFLSNTGKDPLKTRKATRPEFSASVLDL